MSAYCICKQYDFFGDALDVFDVFRDEPHAFLLDSSLVSVETGRFSFVGFDPFKIFSSKGKNAIPELKKLYASYHTPVRTLPFFNSGFVGYFSYDFGRQLENVRERAHDDTLLPDCFFGLYDCMIAVDHQEKRLYITSTGLPEKNKMLRERRAQDRCARIAEKLFSRPLGEKQFGIKAVDADDTAIICSSNFTREEYLKAVRRALDYIAEGDIYQVNVSQRFMTKSGGPYTKDDAFDLYRVLRSISPSSFGGFFDCGDFQIISSSPERFLRVRNGRIDTRPMKGTRPRGKNGAEDLSLKEELLNSAKDRAELLMITDLERNDLGRVCTYGSVAVKEMRTLEEYATVFQTTSTIEGMLKKECDPFDVVAACFPGGSITGCPKIRSMEIIEELEPQRRALYTGSLGYISFSGDMDFNILIRTLLMQKEAIYFHVGGGIVADSDPAKEYDETLTKAQAMQASLARMLSLKGSRVNGTTTHCT